MILTILTVLLWIVGVIAVVMLFALCTPIRVSGAISGLHVNETTGANLDETKWCFRVVWLLGLVNVTGVQEIGAASEMRLRLLGVPIKLGGADRERRPKEPNKSKHKGNEAAARRRKAKAKRRFRMSLQDVRGLIPEIRWLITKLWQVPRMDARGELVYGFEDPATTGWCEALRAMRPLPRQLKLTPDFTEARLEGWLQFRLSVYPIRAVAVMIRAVFRRGVRRIWWSQVKRRFSRAH